MLKRIISGAVFVGIITGFFFLRTLSHAYFEILILVFSAIGTFEMLRAFGSKITLAQKITAMVHSIVCVPVGWFFGMEASLYLLLLTAMLQLAFAVVCHKVVSLESVGLSLFSTVYPSALLLFMTATNAFKEFSTPALLCVFVISPFTDTFAFFVGSLLKGPKLCPEVSPKKTVSGAIGGVVGGIVGAIAICLIYSAFGGEVPPVWFFVIVGVCGAVLTEFGDLVESIIKRKVGIKDMGKIMPGHGGVMDRIDGILFACPFVFACFRLFMLF